MKERSARSLARVAVASGAVAIGSMLTVALLGPSNAEVPLGPGQSLWPLQLALHPSAWLVTGLTFAAMVLSVIATMGVLAALQQGWSPSPRRLLVASFVVVGLFVAVPPIGSADVLDYASYGHDVHRGIDPYRVPPNRIHGDPFAAAVEAPWRGVTSVYGPLATLEQTIVVKVAGDRTRPAVALFDLIHGLAFATCAFLLYRLAATDDRRRRAVLLFGLNPVLLYAVVAGGHIDSLSVLAVVAGVALLRRSPLLAGLAGGAGVLVKLTGALAVVASVESLRHSPRRAAIVATSAGAVVAAGYAVAGFHAFAQVRVASRYASPATPWRAIRAAAAFVIGRGHAATLISVLGSLVALGLIAALHRNLPDDEATARGDIWPRLAVAWTLGWTLAAPYVLSWYDALPWAFVALIAASRYDKILVLHTATLAAVYAPGRANEAVALPHTLLTITTGARAMVAPVILTLLIVVAFAPGLVDQWPRGLLLPDGIRTTPG